jgi:hypothetical protein
VAASWFPTSLALADAFSVKALERWGMMTHTCNPSYGGGISRRNMVQARPYPKKKIKQSGSSKCSTPVPPPPKKEKALLASPNLSFLEL